MNARDFYVDPDIRKASSLPPTAFTSEEFLKLELDKLFPSSWLMVPPANAEMMTEKGAQTPFSILGKSLFLQRDEDDRLHCFPNVCTHAWHPLVETPGVKKKIICPQHGRTFGLDGRFAGQAGFNNLEDFPRGSDHLKNLRVEEWNGLAFCCLGRPFSPLMRMMREVSASMPGLKIGELEQKILGSEIRAVDGNWKHHAWNYMDNFHIRFIHKGPGGLADAVELGSYRTELFEYSALQWVYSKKAENGLDPGLLSNRFRDSKDHGRRVFALWWFVFPSFALNLYPWGLSINVYMPHPEDPGRTEFRWYHLVMDEEKFDRRNEVWLDEQVDAEDLEAIAHVAMNAGSGFAQCGRFAPGEEQGPHWFHRNVYTRIFGK